MLTKKQILAKVERLLHSLVAKTERVYATASVWYSICGLNRESHNRIHDEIRCGASNFDNEDGAVFYVRECGEMTPVMVLASPSATWKLSGDVFKTTIPSSFIAPLFRDGSEPLPFPFRIPGFINDSVVDVYVVDRFSGFVNGVPQFTKKVTVDVILDQDREIGYSLINENPIDMGDGITYDPCNSWGKYVTEYGRYDTHEEALDAIRNHNGIKVNFV